MTDSTVLAKFEDLNLAKPIVKNIARLGYVNATPVQAQAIPHVMQGRDVLASAQTGTGKTAAFALPLLNHLANSQRSSERKPRCLVLCPTRELAEQIGDNFAKYSKSMQLYQVIIYGGVKQKAQVRALERGVDTIIATPGRLLDLMNQGFVDLSHIEALVLDEADRMLDMGFVHDIRRIVAKVPKNRQTLLFSATMPKAIIKLAGELLTDAVSVDITPQVPVVEAIDQQIYFVTAGDKMPLLIELLDDWGGVRTLVFTRTKHGADKVARSLVKQSIEAEAIHGNKSQNARKRALQKFKDGKISVLVATDVASRGIDVQDISYVINFNLTDEPETYVHRIGRTARAGAQGTAVSFCNREERKHLKAIQKLMGRQVPVATDKPQYAQRAENEPAQEPKSRGSRGSKSRRRNKSLDQNKQNNKKVSGKFHKHKQTADRKIAGAQPRKNRHKSSKRKSHSGSAG